MESEQNAHESTSIVGESGNTSGSYKPFHKLVVACFQKSSNGRRWWVSGGDRFNCSTRVAYNPSVVGCNSTRRSRRSKIYPHWVGPECMSIRVVARCFMWLRGDVCSQGGSGGQFGHERLIWFRFAGFLQVHVRKVNAK